MRKIILVLVLVFSCSVAWGHDINGKHRSDYAITDLQAQIDELRCNGIEVNIELITELTMEIGELKARVAELEKRPHVDDISVMFEGDQMFLKINDKIEGR